jgi:hypothetical protein
VDSNELSDAVPVDELTRRVDDDGGAAEASPAVIPVKNPQIKTSRGALMRFSEEPFLPPDDSRLSAKV